MQGSNFSVECVDEEVMCSSERECRPSGSDKVDQGFRHSHLDPRATASCSSHCVNRKSNTDKEAIHGHRYIEVAMQPKSQSQLDVCS